eukprot:COSAG01_NODE_4444_length_5017_cov_4.901179_1_plen_185_part_00
MQKCGCCLLLLRHGWPPAASRPVRRPVPEEGAVTPLHCTLWQITVAVTVSCQRSHAPTATAIAGRCCPRRNISQRPFHGASRRHTKVHEWRSHCVASAAVRSAGALRRSASSSRRQRCSSSSAYGGGAAGCCCCCCCCCCDDGSSIVDVRLYSCTSRWHMCWQQEKCTKSTIQIVNPASNCGPP